jgi:iron complex transport system permease protein
MAATKPGTGGKRADAAVRDADAGYVRRRRKNLVLGIVFILLLLATFIVCLGIGRSNIDPKTTFDALVQNFFGIDKGVDQADVIIVNEVRLPVVIAAVLAGCALSASGATYQGLFKNPLVSPDILGAADGAAFGAALGLLLNMPSLAVQGMAFVFGFVAVMMTYFSAKYISHGTNQTLLLVLAGLIVGTLFQSFVEIIKYVADPFSTLPAITYWLMGSLAKVTWEDLAIFMVPFIIGIVPIFILRWRINTLSLGDDEAKSLGLDVNKTRGILIFCATVLTSAVVAIAGIVGWVGLIIPHLVRFMFGPDNRVVVPMSCVLGAIFMVVVNCFCRSLMSSEIPLGILTSIIGAPFFFIILVKSRKSGEL